jgi:tetratricopeptide (TPR) repeat protein
MAQLAALEVIAAATQLMRAAQWNAAADLVRAARTDDPVERRALALILAEIAVDQDFAQQTDTAASALTAVAGALEILPDATISWDLEMLHLRKDYTTELFASDATTFGPDGRDRAITEALAERVAQLRDQAPDDERRGLASFYAGVIADNLLGDHEAAFTHYTTALELGERTGDDLLASLALRHLGDHAHTAGDLKLARQQWERSTELRQKVGHLLGALAQQTLLAALLRDEGDPSGARTLATEINRWSRQVNLPYLVAQSTDLMS